MRCCCFEDTRLAAGRTADSLSSVLAKLTRSEDGGRLSLDQALLALGDRSYGGVLLLLTLVAMCLPPGLSAFAGAPLALVGLQLMFGRNDPWVPRVVRERSLDRRRAGRLFARIEPTLRRVERFLRPRLPRLLGPIHLRLVGAGCVALSTPMIVPIPFAHSTAGMALLAFASGLIAEDGAALLAGWGMTATSAAVLIGEIALGRGLGAHLL
jgi:hypothetical protein